MYSDSIPFSCELIFNQELTQGIVFQKNRSDILTVNQMHFCPLCGNMLLMEEGGHGMRFCCPTCPYLHNLRRVYSSKVPIKKKQVDDVLGGDNAWENVDRTNARCPQCSHDTAFFMQIQIRSADEPSTTFYRCVRCAKQWNDNS